MKAKISKDIKRYEDKEVGPFTKRQAVCVLIGIGVFALVALLLYRFLPFEIVMMICTVFAMPFVATGFVKISNLTFEKILLIQLNNAIYKSNIRLYKRGR